VKKLSQGGKKAVWGSKFTKKMPEGVKLVGKNCLRGVKLDKTVWGVTNKKHVQGG